MIHYETKIFVGTDPQRIVVQVDTGSSDMWVNYATSTICSAPDSKCHLYGTYTPENSHTYVPVENSYFAVTYADQTGASGNFAIDTITVSDVSIQGVQFGGAYSSGSALGVIGLGYAAGQQGVWQGGAATYPTFPEQLVNHGLVNLNAYSLYLGSLSSPAGSILYGGVDTAKIEGNLVTLPIQPPNSEAYEHAQLWVTLNAASYEGIRTPNPVRVDLDCGSQFTYLPLDFAQSIFTALGAQLSVDGRPYVDCALAATPKTFDFEFGPADSPTIIRVPLSAMIYQDNDKVPLTTPENVPLCILALTFDDDSHLSLGESFLRSAYAVFDLSHNVVSLAQAKYSAESNVVEIPVSGLAALGLEKKC